MKQAETQALYAYWLKQCRGRATPDRHDLDPVEMRGVLPFTFMLDVSLQASGASYTIRLSGTRLDALFTGPLKGHDFLGLVAGEDRIMLATMLKDVLDDSRPAVAGLKGAPAGYDVAAFELLLLPLRHHGRTHKRILCSLVPQAMPTWIGLQTMEAFKLSSWRFVERPTLLPPPRSAGVVGHRHLRVIEGGRAAA